MYVVNQDQNLVVKMKGARVIRSGQRISFMIGRIEDFAVYFEKSAGEKAAHAFFQAIDAGVPAFFFPADYDAEEDTKYTEIEL